VNKKILSLLLASTLTPASAPCAPDFSKAQVGEVQKIMREYLISNPEILQDGIEALQEKKKKDHQDQANAAIAKNKDALMKDPEDTVFGNPKGAKVMIAFLDPFCGHCRRFHEVMNEAISKDKDLKIIIKDIPILGDPSLLAVRALMAGHVQGQYKAVQDFLETADPKQTIDDIIKGMDSVKDLNLDKFKKDMLGDVVNARLKKLGDLASAIGISATPSLVIKDHLIEGGVPYEVLEKLLKGESLDKVMNGA
jgi:protein-disulfide isomerase